MADRMISIKETPNAFQVRGKISGVKKQSFYKEGVSKNGGKWNSISFSVEFEPKKSVFIKLNGFPRKEVFYYKSSGQKGVKGETKRVAWENRMKSPGDDYRLIGVNLGLTQDAKGQNINKTYTEFDAVNALRDMLEDGMDVFIKGNMEFRSYTNRNGDTARSVELIPSQISLCSKEIDFDDAAFEPMAAFENTLVFESIEKEMDDANKHTGRFIVHGYSVGYASVEPVTFIIDKAHAKMADSIKKRVHAFNSIKTFGVINVENQVEVVEDDEDDAWGDARSVMEQRVFAPTIREYVIVKCDPNSLESENYDEDTVMEAIRKLQNSKNAETTFEAKEEAADTGDWGDDDVTDMDDSPWD